MYIPVPYHITAVAVYACILAICILALVFGLRARANVKKEKVTTLARGFSPLDVQRIFIGKTYPRKLTRALIVHWAQMGYIRVTQVSRYRVKLTCCRDMPAHTEKKQCSSTAELTYANAICSTRFSKDRASRLP